MKLKSFGCSFIFGTDLHDDGRDLLIPTPSQVSWPALLAKKMNYDYQCLARPGAGNLQICETLMNDTDDADLYVIGWTWTDRHDYIDESMISPWPGLTKWRTLMPTDNKEPAQTYFKCLQSEYKDKLRSLVYIKTAIDFLQRRDRRFIMTYMDDLLFCRKWHFTQSISDLMDQVHPYLTNFDGKTFLQWSQCHRFPISSTMHPLEAAHESACDLVFDDLTRHIKN